MAAEVKVMEKQREYERKTTARNRGNSIARRRWDLDVKSTEEEREETEERMK